MSKTKPDPERALDDDQTSVDRRTFLRVGVSAAAGLVAACADDGGLVGDDTGTGTDTSGSSGDGDGDPATGDGDPTGDGDGDGDGDPTGDGDGDPTGDGDGDGDPTGDGDGDPLDCDGELIDFDPDAIAQDDALFPLAVMAGEMRPTSVMLAVYIDDASPKLLRVWRPAPEPGQVDLIVETTIEPSADGYAKITVDGLCPGTWYRYAYFDGDAPFAGRSVIGEVRTAIAADSLEPLVVAASACNGSSLEWPALDRSSEEYYDLFLHLGDMAYNDGMFSLDEFRGSWKTYMAAQGFKDAFAGAGLYATWDDHEITDNSSFDRETMDPLELERQQNAFDAYFELLPIDAEGPDYQLWRSFRWGLTAEFIVLDCRYERRPSQGEYMSQEQMAWLKQTLMDSPCHFKVILNSVPITNMPFLWDLAAADRWEGYPESRDELLSFIDQNQIDNIWFIAGDFHVCFVSRLEPMGNLLSSRTREIAMTSGNTNILGDTLELSSNFEYGRGSPRGCMLTFDPATDSVNVRFINTDGSTDFDQDLTQD